MERAKETIAAVMPRLLIAAPASGRGKTTFTCGLLRGLMRRGLTPVSYKSGPDYIDPAFHEGVIGAKSRNLDLFFCEPNLIRQIVAREEGAADIAIIEGAMGFYDGIAMGTDASAWDLACATETPVILVVDGKGCARSLAAEVLGFARMREPSRIAGVVINRTSPMMYGRFKQMIQEETGIPVVGYLPNLPEASFESRHLGLVMAGEIEGYRGKIDLLADALEKSLDWDALLEIASSAAPLTYAPLELPAAPAVRPRIAVGRDRAFNFYYADSLAILEDLGAELVEFSPLEDQALPADVDGLLLGGGYPELNGAQLEANASLRASVREAVQGGMPTVAECGGFMFLQEVLEDAEGNAHAMASALPGRCFPTGKLGRFGYVTLTASKDGLLLDQGQSMPAHEFHYWDSTQPGSDFMAKKPQSTRSWECGISTPSLYAGYPHLYLYAQPEAAARFVGACAAYKQERGR